MPSLALDTSLTKFRAFISKWANSRATAQEEMEAAEAAPRAAVTSTSAAQSGAIASTSINSTGELMRRRSLWPRSASRWGASGPRSTPHRVRHGTHGRRRTPIKPPATMDSAALLAQEALVYQDLLGCQVEAAGGLEDRQEDRTPRQGTDLNSAASGT